MKYSPDYSNKSPILQTTSLSIGYRGERQSFLGKKRIQRNRIVASDISLTLRLGNFICLIGPNGSGKSTLLRTISGMQPALSGECLLNGHSISRLDLAERAGLVAAVLTEQPSGGWFSAFEIVAFGRYPYTDSRGRLSENDLFAIQAALSAVGMSHFSERFFAELSDGEKRKILLARALAQDTPLIILDEPTVFLDAPSRLELFYLTKRLAHDSGKAIVLSTHDVELALRHADRLWLMSPDKCFSEGHPEELALSGRLGEVLSTPTVRYDSKSGAFKPTGVAKHVPSLAVSFKRANNTSATGNTEEEHMLLLWTRRLLIRQGFRPVSASAHSAFKLSIGTPVITPLWQLEATSQSRTECITGVGMSALSDALNKLYYQELSDDIFGS